MTTLVTQRDGNDRVRVRAHLAAISTVSCANVVTERLGERHPEISVLPHQHGCGQLGDDMTLTRELLAALASHPNVTATMLIALGCESNVGDELMTAVRRRGGNAGLVGIQACGGVDAAISEAEGFVRDHQGGLALHEGTADSTEITVGVVADATTRRREPEVVDAVVESLRAEGFSVHHAVDLDVPLRPVRDRDEQLAIPARWRSEPRTDSPVLELLIAEPASQGRSFPLGDGLVERMTVLTAAGSQVLVSLTGRPSLAGAALAPTIVVSTNAEVDVLDDLIDVRFDGYDLAARVVAAVRATVAGQQTRAEHLQLRDLALPRLGPWY